MEKDNPFYRPVEPKNGWELVRWVVFDYLRFRKYEEKLTKKETLLLILKIYILYIVPVAVLLWLAGRLTITLLDLPNLFPGEYKPDFLKEWKIQTDVLSKLTFISSESNLFLLVYLVFGLAGGLGVGLGVGLVGGLAGGLGVGLVGGLAFGLGVGLAFGLGVGLAYGLASGLAYGLVLGLVRGVTFSLARGVTSILAIGLAIGLGVSLAFGLGVGLAFGLAFCVAWYFFHFRIPFYPFHFFASFFSNKLDKNPFLTDAGIWLPIPGLQKKIGN